MGGGLSSAGHPDTPWPDITASGGAGYAMTGERDQIIPHVVPGDSQPVNASSRAGYSLPPRRAVMYPHPFTIVMRLLTDHL